MFEGVVLFCQPADRAQTPWMKKHQFACYLLLESLQELSTLRVLKQLRG
jgi:hypothetical protein